MPLLPAALPTPLAWLLQATWHASVLIVLLFLVQKLCGRWLTARWRYRLWLLLPLALVLPALPWSSPLSVHNFYSLDRPSPPQVAPLPGRDISGSIESDTPPVRPRSASSSPSRSASTATAERSSMSPGAWLTLLWAVGMAVYLLAIGVAHASFWRRVQHGQIAPSPEAQQRLDAVRREIGVRRYVRLRPTDAVTSPCLAGLREPNLLIPPHLLHELPADRLRLIFLHELIHVKRHDLPANLIFALLQAMHWFNPLVWFGLVQLRAERELVRDAMVLHIAGAEAATAYGSVILDALPRNHTPLPSAACLGSTRTHLKRRIHMIAHYQPTTPVRRHLLGGLMLVAIVLTALTAAAEPDPAADTTTERASSDRDATTMEQRLNAPILIDHPRDTPPRFHEVLAYLQDDLDLPLDISWFFMPEAPSLRDRPVDVPGEPLPLRDLLDHVLEQISPADHSIDYRVIDNRIVIGTEAYHERLERSGRGEPQSLETYDLRQLLLPQSGALDDVLNPSDPDGPRPARERSFAGSAAHASDDEAIAQLMQIIRDRLADAGDQNVDSRQAYTMSAWEDRLFVNTTEARHAAIDALLDELRIEEPEVRIEMRYLLIDDTVASALEDTQGVPVDVTTPDGEPGPEQAFLLRDDQVDRLIRAVQGSRATSSLAMPRVQVFSGQAGTIQIRRQQSYVRDVNFVDGEPEPITDVVHFGPAIEIGGQVSDDRRYVDLAFRSHLTFATGPFESQLHPESPPDEPLSIERPSRDEVETVGRVTVPDVATLLIVGDVIEGTFLRDEGAIEDDDPQYEQRRRVAVLLRPEIIIQQRNGLPTIRVPN